MEVFIEKIDERRKMRFSGTVSKLLSLLKLSPESVVVVKNSEVVTEDELLSDKDTVKILSVVSGG
jgi:sulfur carrier protein ThiS